MRRIQQRSKTSGEGWFVTIGQRQQIGVAPHAGRTLRNALASKVAADGLVIVENFQRRETLVTNGLRNISVRLAALATAQFVPAHWINLRGASVELCALCGSSFWFSAGGT